MKRKLFVYPLLLILMFGAMGCSNDDEEQSYYLYDQLVPYQPVAKKDLPAWMLSKIEVIEKADPVLSMSRVYQGKWNSDVVYLITDCLRKDILYSKDGNVLAVDDSSLVFNMQDWKCIYLVYK